MSITSQKTVQRVRRHARIRAKMQGTATCPRLSVYRSNRFMYAQLINDDMGVTLVASDSRSAKGKSARERATEVGTSIATLAKAKGIERVVFDRGGFMYQGSIQALADGARAGGLIF